MSKYLMPASSYRFFKFALLALALLGQYKESIEVQYPAWGHSGYNHTVCTSSKVV